MDTKEKELSLQEYIQQGKMLADAGEFEKAASYFDRVLALDKMNYEAYLNKGIVCINMGDSENARQNLTRATMVDKQNPVGFVHLGNLELLEGNNREAIRYYNNAIALGYQEADVYYFLGLVYENQQELETALRNYVKASHLDNLNAVYYIRRASVQYNMEKYNEALQTLEELRRVCPDSFEGYHMAAAIYVSQKAYQKAEEILKLAEELFPDDKELISDQIKVLLSQEKPDEAIQVLERLESKCEEEIEKKAVLLHKAKIYGQQEKTQEAKRILTEALHTGEKEELDLEASFLLMNYALSEKKYEEVYQYAEALDKGDNQNLYALGGKYYMALAEKENHKPEYKKAYEAAVRYYRSISLDNPTRIEAYLYRAMCLKDIEEYDKALEAIDYVMTLQPNVGQIHFIKGNVYTAMKRTEDAQKEYRIAKDMGVDFTIPMEA